MTKPSKKSTVLSSLAALAAVHVAHDEQIAADQQVITTNDVAGIETVLPPLDEVHLHVIENPDTSTFELTDAELLEALIETSTTPAGTIAPQAAETVAPPATLETMLASLDEIAASLDIDVVKAKAQSIVNEFDAREIAERQKNLDNDSIVKSLRKSRSKLGTLTAAAVLIAASVDEAFINRTIHTGAAYNVFAIDKVADIVAALGGSTLKNAINIAVMKSMSKFRAAGFAFTGEMAKCCASDKIRIAASLSKELVRYTVSASTAPTQASSTMQALQTLGVVINKGSPKLPVYELTDTPATTRLQSLLAA